MAKKKQGGGGGSSVGYRIGGTGETIAWEVLNYEYVELENEHTRDDVAEFLKLSPKLRWSQILAEFRRRYGDATGVWVTETLKDAIYYYAHVGEREEMYQIEYDPAMVVIDLGADGRFVLNPKKTTFIGLSPRKHATVYR